MIPPAPASAGGIPPDSPVQIVLTECCNLQCRHCAVPAELNAARDRPTRRDDARPGGFGV